MSEQPRERHTEFVSSDARELYEIFTAISEFIRQIKEPIKEVISTILEAYDGAKIGKDIGELYRNLVESGVPKELTEEMVREYFKRRMESLPTIATIIDALRGHVTSFRERRVESRE